MNEPREFNPFDAREEQKAKRKRSAGFNVAVKRIVGILVLFVIVVAGMHLIGGAGNLPQWKRAHSYLATIAGGVAPAGSHEEFLSVTRAIPNCRGNRSALAGLYCVHALRMLRLDERAAAQQTLQVLDEQFATERLFTDHWRESSLTEACSMCSQTRRKQKCTACKGTGRKAGLTSGLGGSRTRKRETRKPCLACQGSGEIALSRSACSRCRDKGTVISQAAVQEQLDKALKKARLLVMLKRAQSLIGLRPGGA
jgi:hypothetical protein